METDDVDHAQEVRASILAARAGHSAEYAAKGHYSEQAEQATTSNLIRHPHADWWADSAEKAIERDRKQRREAFVDDVDGWLENERKRRRERYSALVDAQPSYTDVLADEAEELLRSDYTGITEILDGTEDPFPWADHPTGPSKTQFVVVTALSGDSLTDWVHLEDVVEEAFGGTDSKYYGRVDWIADRYSNLLEKRKRGVISEVRATLEALYLMRSMHNSGTLPWAGPSAVSETDYDDLPLQRFRAGVGARRRVRTDGELGHALALLGDHRRTLVGDEGESKVLDDGTITECQRFASEPRAIRLGRKFDRVADKFEEKYDYAVVLTLTMPRECADSPLHSFEVMQDAWERFYQLMRYDASDRPRPGFVPKHMWVQEPQSDGWAHRHIIFPGRTHLMDANDIRADWAKCLRIPKCVDQQPWIRLDRIGLTDGWHALEEHARGDRPIASDANTPSVATAPQTSETARVLADGSGLTVPSDVREQPGIRQYYRKGMTQLANVASMPPSEIAERGRRLRDGEGTSRDREFARLTFMWASEARFTATGGA